MLCALAAMFFDMPKTVYVNGETRMEGLNASLVVEV